jgi:hypothetical protein
LLFWPTAVVHESVKSDGLHVLADDWTIATRFSA